MNQAFLLLGSNIDPEQNILRALEYLHQNCILLEVSHTWRTKPVGSDAADFLNTAAHVETEKDIVELKSICIAHIESLLGRVRVADKNAPRTIDLDIILFNGIVQDATLFRYAHLILPFSELLPDLIDPVSNKSLAELAKPIMKLKTAKKYKCLFPVSQKRSI